MKFKRVIELNTPKGEKVLVNFNNVSQCQVTNNNHTSLRFNYTQGTDFRGVYLIVCESIDRISELLGEKINVSK